VLHQVETRSLPTYPGLPFVISSQPRISLGWLANQTLQLSFLFEKTLP
jgi:hypothetical protein